MTLRLMEEPLQLLIRQIQHSCLTRFGRSKTVMDMWSSRLHMDLLLFGKEKELLNFKLLDGNLVAWKIQSLVDYLSF